MTEKELYKAKVLADSTAGKLTNKEAATLLQLTIRQVRRLKRRLEQGGVAGLAHQSRGSPSNRAFPKELREKIVMLLHDKYSDFGPTFAAEKLEEELGCQISRETVRKIQQQEGLRKTKKHKDTRYHPRRPRRSRVGELVQIDGSIHDWLEGRGPRMSLLAFVDDATSRVQVARFVSAESTQAYMSLMIEYINRFGRPKALYSDKHSIFRQTKESARDRGSLTCFGESLDRLHIDLICAHSPQAKGRVERHFGTQQDRLVKEMRLAGIDTMKEANDFLRSYLTVHNDKFAVAPLEEHDAHVVNLEPVDENSFFHTKEQRKLSKTLSFQYKGKCFQLINPPVVRRLQHKTILIKEMLSGRMQIETRAGRQLEFEPVTEYSQTKQKEMGYKEAALATFGSKSQKPSKHHPWN